MVTTTSMFILSSSQVVTNTFPYLLSTDKVAFALTATVFLIVFIFFSCHQDNEKRLIQQQKELAKNEVVFKKISSAWNFRTMNLQPSSQELVKDWAQWRLFLTELQQKPTSSIGAFQKKSKALSKKTEEVLQSIPQQLFSPEFKSRFTVMLTKFHSLEMYLNLDAIPDQKVISLITDINLQLAAIELQMNELVRKKQIPTEQGEADMIRMLDTSRAVKEIPKQYDVKKKRVMRVLSYYFLTSWAPPGHSARE